MQPNTINNLSDMKNQEWHVTRGGTAYYPLAVKARGMDILNFHAWDSDKEQKAQAIVALQNNMRPELGAAVDEAAVLAALELLPPGPWIVRESKMLNPVAVMAGDGTSPVFLMDFLMHGREVAAYLVDLHKRAMEYCHAATSNKKSVMSPSGGNAKP